MSRLVVATAALLLSPYVFAQPKPPVAAKKAQKITMHGDTRVDDYAWLRDKKNPEVIAHLEAENAYALAMMKGTEGLQQQIYDELLGRMKQSDLTLPIRRGDYFYYQKTEAGKQYPVRARRKGSMDAAEEVVLDLNALAEGHEYIDLGDADITDDGNLYAYTLDTTGNGEYTLFIKDLRTGELLPDRIENVADVVWAAGNKTLFYVAADKVNHRKDRLYRHILGGTADELLLTEPDVLYQFRISKTRDKALLLLETYSTIATETRFLRADEPDGTFKMIAPRKDGHTYIVDHRGNEFYIRTNDHAPNYRLVTVNEAEPSMEHWKEVIPARNDVELFEVNVFQNFMAVSEVQDGNRFIRIVDLRTNKSTPITFDEPVYNLSRDANVDFGTTKFRYRYNSLLSPEAIYEFDMESHVNTLLKRDDAPNYDPSLYASERVWATAADGAKVPVSLVYKKPLVRNGKRPMLMYGYGAYGIPNWPFFVRYQLPLIDRGVVYAIVNVRGGGGMGQAWREGGRMLQKRNTFTDFVAAAEHLVKRKYTSSDRLAMSGRSAGGLLVGAVLNLRPKLFRAVVASSPFFDILNTMSDPSLPLTTSEYKEWGNPNVANEYAYIKSYSPYDNLRAGAYPAMLVEVSLNDTKVGFWEGTKFVAKLREVKTDKKPVLLVVNMGGGHAGSSGRYDATREVAFDYAFLLRELKVDTASSPRTSASASR